MSIALGAFLIGCVLVVFSLVVAGAEEPPGYLNRVVAFITLIGAGVSFAITVYELVS